jgi:hypothetical protein
MPVEVYTPKRFTHETMLLINKAVSIIDRYVAKGYSLTLRQLYYQLVAAGLIPNKQREYNRLGRTISAARRAGLIDWDAIVDRTRFLRALPNWVAPSDIVAGAAEQFKMDLWANQPHRVEVWIEKDALVGVFERVCHELRVPVLSCRGYTSDSELWGAAQRLKAYAENGQDPIILHFGDHDPSGMDMTRDVDDRLDLFSRASGISVERLALNMDQVRRYNPPPNPAKESDSRHGEYARKYGKHSWELDALEPDTLAALVRTNVLALRDDVQWEKDIKVEREHRATLVVAARHWNTSVTGHLKDRHGKELKQTRTHLHKEADRGD